jgi:hypothetical protein
MCLADSGVLDGLRIADARYPRHMPRTNVVEVAQIMPANSELHRDTEVSVCTGRIRPGVRDVATRGLMQRRLFWYSGGVETRSW